MRKNNYLSEWCEKQINCQNGVVFEPSLTPANCNSQENLRIQIVGVKTATNCKHVQFAQNHANSHCGGLNPGNKTATNTLPLLPLHLRPTHPAPCTNHQIGRAHVCTPVT